MKSLNDRNFGRSDIFSDEIINFIIEEGFKIKNNDSYNEELEGSSVYHKFIQDINSFDVGVYIGKNGIAVDKDYDCGGNMGTTFFKFYDNNFEEAYDKMVEYVNDYLRG